MLTLCMLTLSMFYVETLFAAAAAVAVAVMMHERIIVNLKAAKVLRSISGCSSSSTSTGDTTLARCFVEFVFIASHSERENRCVGGKTV